MRPELPPMQRQDYKKSLLSDCDVNNGRQFELDIAKTVAIFFMAVIHVGDSMSTFDYSVYDVSLYQKFINFIGGPLAAPIFMFAMGVGMAYTRHRTPAAFAKRGVKLMIYGYLLNFFREGLLMLIARMMGMATDYDKPLIYSIFNIDILQFAGIAFMLAALFMKLKMKPVHMLGTAVVLQAVGTMCIGCFSGLADAWKCIIGLFFFTNEYSCFPAFLWLIYPMIGLCFAETLKRVTDKRIFYKRVGLFSLCVFVALTVSLHYMDIDTWSFYSGYENLYYRQNLLGTVWMFSIVGMAMTVFYFMTYIVKGSIESFIKWASAGLNSIYIIHWLVITYTIAIMELAGIERINQAFIIPTGVVVVIAAMLIYFTYEKIKNIVLKNSIINNSN